MCGCNHRAPRDQGCSGVSNGLDGGKICGGSIRIGILTVSDRASRGEYADEGGPAVHDYLREVLSVSWEPEIQIVSDEVDCVAAAIEDMSSHGCCLIITTGGTGPAPRDITPEATERVCSKMLPGFGELMRQVSLQYVPTAILSRQTAGVCGGALVVNLPGRPKSICECLDAVFPAIPYCIDLIHTGNAPTALPGNRPNSHAVIPPARQVVLHILPDTHFQ